jgi:ParB family chromosome partitioning protein
VSTRSRLAQVAQKRAAYQPVGLTLASEPGVYANRNAVIVEIARIRPNPRNPRTAFPAEALEELAQSIRANGLYNPITVRRDGDHYTIVAGERRYRAALQIGLSELPCIVVDISDDDAYVASLIENLQREDLQPYEEAEALGLLVNERGMGVREVGRLIHKSVFYVSTKVRVAQDPELLQAVKAGLPMTAAQQLVAVREPERRKEIIERFQRGEVKVHHLQRLLRPVEPPRATREQQSTRAPEEAAVLYEIAVQPSAAPITAWGPPDAPHAEPSHPAASGAVDAAAEPVTWLERRAEDAQRSAHAALEGLVARFTSESARVRAELERALGAGALLAPAHRERLTAELAAWQALLARQRP